VLPHSDETHDRSLSIPKELSPMLAYARRTFRRCALAINLNPVNVALVRAVELIKKCDRGGSRYSSRIGLYSRAFVSTRPRRGEVSLATSFRIARCTDSRSCRKNQFPRVYLVMSTTRKSKNPASRRISEAKLHERASIDEEPAAPNDITEQNEKTGRARTMSGRNKGTTSTSGAITGLLQ